MMAALWTHNKGRLIAFAKYIKSDIADIVEAHKAEVGASTLETLGQTIRELTMAVAGNVAAVEHAAEDLDNAKAALDGLTAAIDRDVARGSRATTATITRNIMARIATLVRFADAIQEHARKPAEAAADNPDE